MKKLSKKEWIGVVVALVIVGVFMIFPQVLKSIQGNSAMPEISPAAIDTAQLPQ
ncbi:MAG: hypothetical protein PHS53_03675 [Candidatus Pacebacteria bacterium]|nr:hypothetical protein [Candidatus Paceibacterota bacterium]MDD5357216.1 hypothetical protein [Candidatus Paceibacterota bacterium]